jgi:hypothetical protein
MKTTSLKPVILLVLLALTFSFSHSQNGFDKSATLQSSATVFNSNALDNLVDDADLYAFEDTKPIDYYDIQDDRSVAAILARTWLALGVGLGFGESQTLWCLHAAYYMQLAMFANSALYTSLGLVYGGSNYNDFTSNLLDLELKLLMFTALTKYKEVFLMYGAAFAYGFGSEKFNSFTTDITRFTASLVLGLNIILTTTVSLALQTSVFAFQRTNYKPENGNDYNDSVTRVFLNKQNVFALSVFLNLWNNRMARN